MINQLSKQNKGSVLLYSLLVISLITAIAIIISVIVVNEIQQTSAASNGIQAYYAAESGIEKGLHTVKILRNDPTADLDQAVTDIGNFADDNFENKAKFKNIQTDSVTAKVVNREVKENDYIQIDYYDVNNPLNPTTKVVGITVKNSGDNPATWAEVSWTAWDSNGVLGTSTSAKKIIGPTDLAKVDGWPINNLDVFEADPLPLGTGFDGDPVGYRVRIKALKAIPTAIGDGDLSSLTVIPYDNTPPPLGTGDEVVDLPTQLVIKSVGERNNFKQSLTAIVPWNLPLFGLYDYVIYSEGDILKDIILSSPTYSSGIIEIESDIDPDDSCNPTQSCNDCKTNYNWDGICPTGAPDVNCFGKNNTDDTISGQCRISSDNNLYGFILPIPDSIPAGEEYYVSFRAFYDCSGGGCDSRNLAFEINGNSYIVNDQASGSDEVWKSCTIPDGFNIGDPELPEDDPSRTIKITNYPYGVGWTPGDSVRLDWYQISTYKVFSDCE